MIDLTLTISWIVMQGATTCSQDATGPSRYNDMWSCGNWFDAIVMPFMDMMGPLFPLTLALWMAGILFIWSGSISLPTVVLILMAGLIIEFLPAEAQTAALFVLLAGIALALYSAWMNSGGRR